MNKLRKAEHLCDVTLKVEQTLFPAHRLVLAAVSDYFAAMFTGEVRTCVFSFQNKKTNKSFWLSDG